MTFDEKIQWFAHNDDDLEDFGDPGGYNESLDNEYEEEEEEESVGGGEERPAVGGGGMGGGMSDEPRATAGAKGHNHCHGGCIEGTNIANGAGYVNTIGN